MRHIYIDLGAYDGDTVEEFRNWSKIAFDEGLEWQIYAFDPNPNFRAKWDTIEDANTKFFNEAAWTSDRIMQLAIEQSDVPYGSTIMKGKKKIWDNSPKIPVQTFDFSDFLQQFKDDFVVCKMDIEGAEFPVLKKMIGRGSDLICNWLMVEFHPNKVVEYTTDHKNQILERLKARNPNVREWH